jgi:hypothetical protein
MHDSSGLATRFPVLGNAGLLCFTEARRKIDCLLGRFGAAIYSRSATQRCLGGHRRRAIGLDQVLVVDPASSGLSIPTSPGLSILPCRDSGRLLERPLARARSNRSSGRLGLRLRPTTLRLHSPWGQGAWDCVVSRETWRHGPPYLTEKSIKSDEVCAPRDPSGSTRRIPRLPGYLGCFT